MTMLFAAVHEFVIGPKRTFGEHRSMSAIGGRADMAMNGPNLCF
jgi:hypothetical protein